MNNSKIQKVRNAIIDMERALDTNAKQKKANNEKIRTMTRRLKACKANIKKHVEMLRDTRDALVKNKLSTDLMVQGDAFENVDEFAEHINFVFNSLIRNAETILED